jgi:sugar phosphate isomerase/epimerase
MTDDALLHLKGRFPFRLGTSSYILPEGILPNLRFLGPHLDEVELVLFESQGEANLPSPEDTDAMARLGREMDLTFNVHLHTDLYLGSEDFGERSQACDTHLRFYEQPLPLNPTAYILHFERQATDSSAITEIAAWRQRLRSSLERLLERGLRPDLCALENLSYPFPWVDILAEEYGLNVCLDIGHLLQQGVDRTPFFNRYADRIAMVHLHGVRGRDHQALTEIPHREWLAITDFLRTYGVGVSLEVFSLAHLRASLEKMAEIA